MLTALGTAQRRAGLPEHRDTLREAGRIALRLADRDLLVGVALSRDAGIDEFTEVDPDRLAVLEAALAAVGPADSAARARLLACLAEENDPRDAIRRSEMAGEAIDIARRTGDDATLLAVLNLALNPLNRPTRSIAGLRSQASRWPSPTAAVTYRADSRRLIHRAYAVMETGDLDEFDARLTELETIAERTGLPFQRWQVHRCLARGATCSPAVPGKPRPTRTQLLDTRHADRSTPSRSPSTEFSSCSAASSRDAWRSSSTSPRKGSRRTRPSLRCG